MITKSRLSRFQGEFVWHSHQDTDELFLILSGQLTIQLRDRDVVLRPGQLFVVPRGVEHCPSAHDGEVHAVLIEPIGTANTGDTGGPHRDPRHDRAAHPATARRRPRPLVIRPSSGRLLPPAHRSGQPYVAGRQRRRSLACQNLIRRLRRRRCLERAAYQG